MNFIGKLGVAFIVIGIIGSIGILISFDWEEWNSIKNLSLSYGTEIAIMRQQLFSTVIASGAALMMNVAIGSILIALDKIVDALDDTRYEMRRLRKIVNEDISK